MILAVAGHIHPDARAYIAHHERITAGIAAKQSAIVDGVPGF